jgi:hypothetical protein
MLFNDLTGAKCLQDLINCDDTLRLCFHLSPSVLREPAIVKALPDFSIGHLGSSFSVSVPFSYYFLALARC